MKTKIFAATCENNVVQIGGVTVDVVILSQGTLASTGVVVLEGGVGYYVASNASDIATLIESLVAALGSIKTILTGLDGGTVIPNTQAAAIAALSFSTINSQKDNLK